MEGLSRPQQSDNPQGTCCNNAVLTAVVLAALVCEASSPP